MLLSCFCGSDVLTVRAQTVRRKDEHLVSAGAAAQQRKQSAMAQSKDPPKRYDGDMVTMRMPLAAAAALGGIALHFI